MTTRILAGAFILSAALAAGALLEARRIWHEMTR
jgi:hypothetical protein